MNLRQRIVNSYNALRGRSAAEQQTYIFKGSDNLRQSSRSDVNIFGEFQYQQGTRIYALYETLRSAFPMLNASILLYTYLIGSPQIKSENPKISDTLNKFNEGIKINDLQKGVNTYLKQVIDSYLETGMTFTEIVPDIFFQNVNRLLICNTKNMRFVRDKSTGLLQFAQVTNLSLTPEPFKNQEWFVYCAHDLRKGDPVGRSIYDSLPIVGQIYFRIMKAIESQAERLQNISFYTKSKTDKDSGVSPEALKAFYASIKTALENWQRGKSLGEVIDVMIPALPGTDVDLKVVGGDAQLMDIEIPWRMVMSQFEAATGLPGFLVGYYGGASSFRLTQHQSDILNQRVWNYREDVGSNLRYIHEQQLIMQGITDTGFSYEWEGVSLQDLVETARAALLNAQAQKAKAEILISLFNNGLIPEETLVDELIRFEIIDLENIKIYGYENFIRTIKTKGIKGLIGLTVKNILNQE